MIVIALILGLKGEKRGIIQFNFIDFSLKNVMFSFKNLFPHLILPPLALYQHGSGLVGGRIGGGGGFKR